MNVPLTEAEALEIARILERAAAEIRAAVRASKPRDEEPTP